MIDPNLAYKEDIYGILLHFYDMHGLPVQNLYALNKSKELRVIQIIRGFFVLPILEPFPFTMCHLVTLAPLL